MLRLLVKTAKKSPRKEKHATALIRGGSIVSIECNLQHRHSEHRALAKIWPNKRKGLKFINIRIRPDGNIGLSMPCPKCRKMLVEFGIREGKYSTENGFVEIKL